MSEGGSARGGDVDRSREQLCLVTGASGFIGGRLVERLMDVGASLRCLVRSSSDTTRLAELGVRTVRGDLTSAPSLARAVEGCDYVLHCGALVSDWATKQEMLATNVQGTRNLLAACAQASVKRIVHVSSTDVYGHPGAARIDESYTPQRFRNWYAQTKLEAEREVRRAQASGTLETVILRPATVYGPGSADVIGEIARAIRAGNMLLVDKGRAIAGLCYIDNLVDVVLLALHEPAAAGQAFNVSDGLGVTWRQFADDLAAGLGCRPVRWSLPLWLASAIGFSLEHGYRVLRQSTGLTTRALLSRQAVQVLGINQDFDARKARQILDWEPRVDYASGLEATLAWLKAESLGHGQATRPRAIRARG